MQTVWGALSSILQYKLGDPNYPIQYDFSCNGSESYILRAQSELDATKIRFYVNDIFVGYKSISEAYRT